MKKLILILMVLIIGCSQIVAPDNNKLSVYIDSYAFDSVHVLFPHNSFDNDFLIDTIISPGITTFRIDRDTMKQWMMAICYFKSDSCYKFLTIRLSQKDTLWTI
jgi:hypothetical protein